MFLTIESKTFDIDNLLDEELLELLCGENYLEIIAKYCSEFQMPILIMSEVRKFLLTIIRSGEFSFDLDTLIPLIIKSFDYPKLKKVSTYAKYKELFCAV